MQKALITLLAGDQRHKRCAAAAMGPLFQIHHAEWPFWMRQRCVGFMCAVTINTGSNCRDNIVKEVSS